jgi:hypothetical protein
MAKELVRPTVGGRDPLVQENLIVTLIVLIKEDGYTCEYV